MSMEFDTFLGKLRLEIDFSWGSRGKRLKSEWGSGSKGKRLKSELKLEVELKSEAEQAELKQKKKRKLEAEQLELIKKLLKPEVERVELIKKRLESEEEQLKLIEKLEAQHAEWKQKTKLHVVVDRDFSKYDDIAEPYIYKDGDFVYKNKAWKESEVAVEEYKKLCDELRTNEYDGIPPPPMVDSLLALSGGGPYSCAITDENRPTLTAFSHLALMDYNQHNQGPTFVFHQLVKCSFCQTASEGYYITFQAKAQEEEDPSNSPATITTFQAIVWWKAVEEELPRVQECKIKI